MARRNRFNFGNYSLDRANELLWKGSERIALRPKTFALLKYLTERPGRLVTKQELLNTLWENLNIGEEALKHCVKEIRTALDDSAQSPQFIETVFRRGYRFIGAENSRRRSDNAAQPQADGSNALQSGFIRNLVGRKSELAQLNHALAKAMSGKRQIVFIAGDQGMGKTSLIDAFLHNVDTEQPARTSSNASLRLVTARGQCIKSHGAGEAYMPILEALTTLCSLPEGKAIVPLLRRHAPLWLIQMPSLISALQLRNLKTATVGSTRERMLREMAETIEALTAEKTLILVLEDLQWSDCATLDLISYWGHRRASARFLLIASYRLAEISTGDHPLRSIRDELLARQLCQELNVPVLDRHAIGEYLFRRFPSGRFSEETESWLHNRTGGNPLLMVNVLDHLQSRNLIVQHNRNWELGIPLAEAEQSVPPSIQQIIEGQFEQCTPHEQRLLQAASVEGMEFSAEAVAAALGDTAERIGVRCRRLVEKRLFLQPLGYRRVSGSRQVFLYGFIHAMYQSACYQLAPEDFRTRIHRRLAEYIEDSCVAGIEKPAAWLAMHFARGREPGRALKYYLEAAEKDNLRYAGHEAEAMARQGLDLLQFLPRDSERMAQEMRLLLAFGTAMMFRRGIGSEEVSRAFSRARDLFNHLDPQSQSGQNILLFSALNGLWHFHWVRAEYAEARDLAENLMDLAKGLKDPAMQQQAHHSLGIILMDHGEFADAYEHLAQGTGIFTRFGAALLQWNLGFPDQAVKNMEETLAIARESRNPEKLIFANQGAARIFLACRDYRKTLEHARNALDLASKYELVDVWTAPMKGLLGWAIAKLGQMPGGLEQTRQALDVLKRVGNTNLAPLLSGIHAEISMDAGHIEEGLAAVSDALEVAQKTGMRHYDAELYRLKGELLLRQAYRHPISYRSSGQRADAEACFERSIEIARQQQSRSFELRATTSLARLLQSLDRTMEAKKRLDLIYNWFSEGHKTLDLKDAGALLQEL